MPASESLERLRSLVALYYPGALPILERYDERVKQVGKVLRDEVSKAMEPLTNDSAKQVKAIAALTMAQLAEDLGPALTEIHAYMVEAVKPYATAPDALWTKPSAPFFRRLAGRLW